MTKELQARLSSMPEGPEIRRAADELESAVAGRLVEKIYFAFERLKRYESQLTSRTITAVETRGKALLTHFDNNLSIFSHNQLYGKWVILPAGTKPPAYTANRSLRLAVYNCEYSALLYSASTIEVLRTAHLASHPFLASLGPDCLGIEPEQALIRLNSPEFSKRKLGSLLLDHGFIAGIGNYLRSEILYAAGLLPDARPADLQPPQLRRLAEACVSVVRNSYSSGGITIDKKEALRLKQKGLAYKDYRHWVFGREHKPCFRCKTYIDKINVAGRRLYLCPVCQKNP